MESNKCGQTTFSCADNFMNSLLSAYEDPVRMLEYQCSRSTDSPLAFNGFSEVKMQAMHSDTYSSKAHVPVSVSGNSAGMGTQAVFDYSEVKPNYVSSIEWAGIPCLYPCESTGKKRNDTSVLSYQRLPTEESFSMEPHMLMDWQHAESHAFPVHQVKMEQAEEFNYNLKGEGASSAVVSKDMYRECRQRSKTTECERNRRTLIAERMHALGDLLPSSSKVKRGDQECIVDNVIAYVKYLQLQLKELSRSRLGGESVRAPLNFIEGYGHYHPHEKILKESLEEVFGSLLQENPEEALRVLKRKGFYMMPRTCLDGSISAE